MTLNLDPFMTLKSMAKDAWASFAPMEIYTAIPAQNLVRFAKVKQNQRVLDVACGTGVVALAAAQRGAEVFGCDLTPNLIARAKENASIAQLDVKFMEGDVENLPYENDSFDVVLSQYGHIFAPRSAVALSEMLRVLEPGGTIAFSAWPSEHLSGRMFNLMAEYSPLHEGASSPMIWGDVAWVSKTMNRVVNYLTFDRGTLEVAALSIPHYVALLEQTIASFVKLVQSGDTPTIMHVRTELAKIVGDYYENGIVRSNYLMVRGLKTLARTLECN